MGIKDRMENLQGGAARVSAEEKDAYEAALAAYGAALELFHKGDYARAGEQFAAIVAEHPDEPELSQRARTYGTVCSRKVAVQPAEPTDVEDCYRAGVVLLNAGKLEEALRMLDRALAAQPQSVDALYARASAWALGGHAARAVADLRQAVTLEPKLRFQAVNDPDFERIREEPTFIDVIEPTPTGA